MLAAKFKLRYAIFGGAKRGFSMSIWQKKRAMLDYCLTVHVLIQLSQCPQTCANDQQKCVNSRVKALKKYNLYVLSHTGQNY